ncbi:MAG: FAD-dependent monooxygenase [Betaproteobacteria bacterium]
MLHDVAIVGAGPVGGTLALALADAGLEVIALDARAVGTTLRGDRALALSHGARLIFERLGVWSRLASTPDAVTAIEAIDISQMGGFGVTRLAANELGLSALGYVVSYVALQGAIDAALTATSTLIHFDSAVTQVSGTGEYAMAVVGDHANDPLLARLAVVADGAGTAVAGITRERRDYGQTAVIAKVWMARPHAGVAYERFTSAGPMALLPEGDHYGLVWTMSPDAARVVLDLTDDEFLTRVAASFGARVTGFERVAQRKSFPLALEFARPTTAARTILIGNAAQSLHPIAGQGFNLGVRDAFELGQTILHGDRSALGSRAMVDAYAARRRLDRLAGMAFTHGLTRMFAIEHPAVRWPRGLALALLDVIPPVKKAFTRAMLYGAS